MEVIALRLGAWELGRLDYVVELQGVRTLVPEEGGGLYRVRQTPPALSYTVFKVHKGGAFLVTPIIK